LGGQTPAGPDAQARHCLSIRAARTNVQKAAAIVGGVFLLVGVLVFIPGITTNFGDLSFAGHHSDARLFGLFQVSILHNIVHLLFGITGLAMARTAAQARTYLVFGGATIGSVLQDSGQRSTLDSLLHSGIWRVVAGDGESIQDHDRNRAVDKGGHSRGVFARK
jgi:hypothetical protein